MAVVAQWLLCVWQASALRAPWWAVLLLLVTLGLIETCCMPPRRPSAQRGWPELLRAWITLSCMYFASLVLFSTLWSGGRALGTILLVLAASALFPVLPPANLALACDAVGMLVALLSVLFWSQPAPSSDCTPMPHDWWGWVHLVCLLHLMLVSNRHEAIGAWRIGASLLLVSVLILLHVDDDHGVMACAPAQRGSSYSAWLLLLVLPSIALQMQRLVREFITPILEALCHPGLYELLVRTPAFCLSVCVCLSDNHHAHRIRKRPLRFRFC